MRSAGRIDKAGCVVPSFPFLIGVIKKEKALDAARKSQIEFYVELTKELYKSNKLDCSRESDKCRRKRVSYMANKLRQ